MQLAFFAEPAARQGDPETSQQAAATAKELQAAHIELIRAALAKYGPLGKDAIAARTRLDGVQICRRLSEMNRIGIAVPTGRTVQSTAGRAEREWRLNA